MFGAGFTFQLPDPSDFFRFQILLIGVSIDVRNWYLIFAINIFCRFGHGCFLFCLEHLYKVRVSRRTYVDDIKNILVGWCQLWLFTFYSTTSHDDSTTSSDPMTDAMYNRVLFIVARSCCELKSLFISITRCYRCLLWWIQYFHVHIICWCHSGRVDWFIINWLHLFVSHFAIKSKAKISQWLELLSNKHLHFTFLWVAELYC